MKKSNALSLKDFSFPMPKELIAHRPLKRGASRMLVVNRATNELIDSQVSLLKDWIPSKDALIVNDTKVCKYSLEGKKSTGGKVSILLLDSRDSEKLIWRALTKPGLKIGQSFVLDGSKIGAECTDVHGDNQRTIKFDKQLSEYFKRHGKMPLPPYIKRTADQRDEDEYQTVYAKKVGSVAAPTAGLHFSDNLLDGIKQKGVAVESLTLHVGPGTFQPVRSLQDHKMHSEVFELDSGCVERLNLVKSKGGKVWAVGTTSTRVLETCTMKGRLIPGEGETDLFIVPPFKFEYVDHLMTNFHLPESTLFMLVCAFGGMDLMRKAYLHAVNEKYRFFSYGDAMLII